MTSPGPNANVVARRTGLVAVQPLALVLDAAVLAARSCQWRVVLCVAERTIDSEDGQPIIRNESKGYLIHPLKTRNSHFFSNLLKATKSNLIATLIFRTNTFHYFRALPPPRSIVERFSIMPIPLGIAVVYMSVLYMLVVIVGTYASREPFRAGQSLIPTSNPSKLSADTPRKRGPLVESWDGERFAGRLPTVRAERDSPARFVHSRQATRGSSEKERGLRST